MGLRACVLAIASVLGLCSTCFAEPISSPLEPPTNYGLPDVTISMRRTACLGSCPGYKLTLRGTGICTYSGRNFVRLEGDTTFTVSQQVIVDLLNDLNAMYFFNLRDRYTQRDYVLLLPNGKLEHSVGTSVDDPHLILTVQIGSYIKTVEKNLEFGPKELVTIADKIDKITNSAQWTAVPKR